MSNKHPITQISDTVADTAAGVSAISFGVTLANVETIVSIIAGAVAIVAGAAAAYYHIKKARSIDDDRAE